MTVRTNRPGVGFTDNRQAVIDRDLITASVLSVDEAARGAERRWGVGRLLRLVSPATLVRFRAAHDLWTTAYSHDRDVAATVKTSAMMIRAWQTLEAEATEAGHAHLAPTAWEGRTEDGRVLVIVRTNEEALAVQSARDDRARCVWTVDELARCVAMFEAVSDIKRAFPGATVSKVSPRDASFVEDWATSDPLTEALHGAVP
jgi:hypothetical protein